MSEIMDALLKSQKGQALVVQVKSQKAWETQAQKDAEYHRFDKVYAAVTKTFPKYFSQIRRVETRLNRIAQSEQQTAEALAIIGQAKQSEVDWDIAHNYLIG